MSYALSAITLILSVAVLFVPNCRKSVRLLAAVLFLASAVMNGYATYVSKDVQSEINEISRELKTLEMPAEEVRQLSPAQLQQRGEQLADIKRRLELLRNR